VEAVTEAVAKARNNNIPVLYVVLAFRPGLPEISASNISFQAFKERMAKVPMDTFTQIHSAITPKENDIVIHKKRISAFSGSDLEVVLRAFGINHLVLTGVSTSGIVLSTLREAADKDYKLTVLSDGCTDTDDEVHRVLTTKIFPRQATVVTASEWDGK
jgi:nicotinamidase-related amidase